MTIHKNITVILRIFLINLHLSLESTESVKIGFLMGIKLMKKGLLYLIHYKLLSLIKNIQITNHKRIQKKTLIN